MPSPPSPQPKYLLIVDFTSKQPSLYPIDVSNETVTDCGGAKTVFQVAGCAGDTTAKLNVRLNAIQTLPTLLKAIDIQPPSTNPQRLFATAKDVIAVVAIVPATIYTVPIQGDQNKLLDQPFVVHAPAITIQPKETALASQLSTDLKALANLAIAIISGAKAANTNPDCGDRNLVAAALSGGAKTKTASLNYWVVSGQATLVDARANLAIAVTPSSEAKAVATFAKTSQACQVASPGGNNSSITPTGSGASSSGDAFDDALTKFEQSLVQTAFDATHDVKCDSLNTQPDAGMVAICEQKNLLMATNLDKPLIGKGFTAIGSLNDQRAFATLKNGVEDAALDDSSRGEAFVGLTKLTNNVKAQSAAPGSAVNGTFITGKPEHFFLSADVVLSSAGKLQFDSSSQQLKAVNDPSVFFVGFNYLFGDMKDEAKSILQSLAVRFDVLGSKRPWESVGVALAIRGTHFGINLETVSPSVGWYWTQQDAIVNGTPRINSTRSSVVRVGVAVNLDKALDWVSSSSKGSSTASSKP
jgi:hypothetical protein